MSNLSKHGIVDDTVNFISNELYNVLREKYEPQQGEILLSKDATPGIAYFLDESVQGIIASGILRLSLIEDIPPYYLELVLNSIFVQLQIEQSVEWFNYKTLETITSAKDMDTTPIGR